MKAKNVSISEMKWTLGKSYLVKFIDEFSARYVGLFQGYEFWAKILHTEMKLDDYGNMIRYVIASPIYVALSSGINERIVMDGKIKNI